MKRLEKYKNENNILYKLISIIILMRPKQWIKNTFVLAAVIFSHQAFNPMYIIKSIFAFLIFCLASSTIYILNDLIDVDKDKLHPKKKYRPIASGSISRREGIVLLTVLVPLVFVISFKMDILLGYIILCYSLNNIIYSFIVKNVVILDVMSIAVGFLLRVVAGAIVIRVNISPWILLCTFLLALFLGFSKRRNELVILQERADSHRKILEEYSLEFIDQMLGIVTACTVMAYSLYTFFAYETYYMMATIPFVLYGIFRYQYIIYMKNEGGSPEETLFKDIPLFLDVLLWIITSAIVIYLI